MSEPLQKFRFKWRANGKQHETVIEAPDYPRACYKLAVDQQRIKPPPPANMGYPESLEVLVEGAQASGTLSGKIRFLRRIPVDPFTGRPEWGLRSINDETNSTSWGGGNVFDVYSQAKGAGMNNISYLDW